MIKRKNAGYLHVAFAILFVSVLFGPIISAEAANKLYFSDDFENGRGKWSTSGQDWAVIDTDAHSGSHSITDSPEGNYGTNTNTIIELAKPIDLSGATAPVLSFWHKFSTYCNYWGCYDTAYVEISQDGGFTWTELAPYAGTNNSWNKVMLDLTPYKDKPLLLRFRMWDNSGEGTEADGWYIDDVLIKELSSATTYFSDNFEGSNILPDFSDVTLTANPAPGWAVAKWTGCNGTSGDVCTVNRYVNKKVKVTFKHPMPPTVSIGPPSAPFTNDGPITYTVTYGGADTITLSPGDVTLNNTGTADGKVTVSGKGIVTRTVTISDLIGDGTLGINIAAGTASNSGGLAPEAGPSATFTVDNTPPTLSISAPSPPFTNDGPITYTVTYGGADTITLSPGDVTLNKTGTADGNVVVSGDGTVTRTVTILDITGQGTLSISIGAGTAKDLAGNSAGGAGPSGKVNVGVPSAPTLLSPKGKVLTPTPTHSWNAVPGADSYVLWIGTPNVVLMTQRYSAADAGCPSGTGICSVTPPPLPGHGKYSWKVRGLNSVGAGPWSTRLWFTY